MLLKNMFTIPLIILCLTACQSTPTTEKSIDKNTKITDSYKQILTSQEIKQQVAVYIPQHYVIDENLLRGDINNLSDDFVRIHETMALQQLLRDRKYKELHNIIAELEQENHLNPTDFNENKLFGSYGTFNFSRLDYSEYFDEWVQQNPNSHIPWLARARYRINLGWKARGFDTIPNTDKERISLMSNVFIAAYKDIEKALEISPNSVVALREGFGILVVLGQPIQHDYFYHSINLHPTSKRLLTKYIWSLSPNWGGTQALWDELFSFIEMNSPQLTSFIKSQYFFMLSKHDAVNKKQLLETALSLDSSVAVLLEIAEDEEDIEKAYSLYKDIKYQTYNWNDLVEGLTWRAAFRDKDTAEECIGLISLLLIRGEVSALKLRRFAHCLAVLGNNYRAKNALEAALKYDPNNSGALSYLSKINKLINRQPENYDYTSVDNKMIDRLTSSGKDISQYVDIVYYISCPDKEVINGAVEGAARLDYLFDYKRYSKKTEAWRTRVMKSIIPTPKNITKHRNELLPFIKGLKCNPIFAGFKDHESTDKKYIDMLIDKGLDLSVPLHIAFSFNCKDKSDLLSVGMSQQKLGYRVQDPRYIDTYELWQSVVWDEFLLTISNIDIKRKRLESLLRGKECTQVSWHTPARQNKSKM